MKNEEQLKIEVKHIFDSGANEVRVFEMIKNFIQKNYSEDNIEQYEFTNNAKYKFVLFNNEDKEKCLNFSNEKELISCFIFEDNDVNDIKRFFNTYKPY